MDLENVPDRRAHRQVLQAHQMVSFISTSEGGTHATVGQVRPRAERVGKRKDAGRTVAALLCLCVAQQAFAGPSPTADPQLVRRIAAGEIVGTRGGGGSLAWLGIPYAEAPVGANRWRAPKTRQAWLGRLHADRFGSRCPQRASVTASELASVGNEDCLFLNVWSPATAPKTRGSARNLRPVMVWIHSGANVSRAGSDFDGGKLAVRGDVIVVTINYRLGVFGWFHHPSLRRMAESADDGSGNFGTLDQIEALHWVQKHINNFGGDARNVTVFGESAGGWNIYALLESPRAKGLFHRAIIQSGNMPFYSLAQASNERDAPDPGMPKSSAELLLQLLIDGGMATDRMSARQQAAQMTSLEVADFLRARSHLELIRAEEAAFAGWARSAQVIGQQRYLPGPIRDGVVLPTEPFLERAALRAEWASQADAARFGRHRECVWE